MCELHLHSRWFLFFTATNSGHHLRKVERQQPNIMDNITNHKFIGFKWASRYCHFWLLIWSNYWYQLRAEKKKQITIQNLDQTETNSTIVHDTQMIIRMPSNLIKSIQKKTQPHISLEPKQFDLKRFSFGKVIQPNFTTQLPLD